MRRLHGGLLTAALLLAAGCGSGRIADNASPPATAPIRTPTLAVSTQASAAALPGERTVTVLVTSPDGFSSPGLDAAVSVLLERPEVDVSAFGTAGEDAAGGVPAQTMSGFPVHVVARTEADPLAVTVGQLDTQVDLVVVGVVEGAALGTAIESSSSTAVVRSAQRLGLPVLVVTAGTEHGADLAAAGLMLRSLLDLQLHALVEPGARLLTVPSCDGGLVRGLVVVPASSTGSTPAAVDCRNATGADPVDDVEAHGAGFATLVELRA